MSAGKRHLCINEQVACGSDRHDGLPLYPEEQGGQSGGRLETALHGFALAVAPQDHNPV